MNSVSWFIYAADVIQNMGVALLIVAILTGIASLVTWIIYGISHFDGEGQFPFKTPVSLTSVAAASLLICTLVPAKTTMYAIAASQLGEVALSSPGAKEMIDDTKQILRDYLKSLKKETK